MKKFRFLLISVVATIALTTNAAASTSAYKAASYPTNFPDVSDERAIITTGQCGEGGDDVTYTLYDDGEFVVSGTGQMGGYNTEATCPWNEYKSQVKSVVIEEGVTEICYVAFDRCSNLTSVDISNTVTVIGDFAFCDCHSLSSVTMPNSLKKIGRYAFTRDDLRSLVLPNSVTEVGYGAFWANRNLTSVTLSNSLTKLEDMVFSVCSSLSSIVIPNSVTRIESAAFDYCSSLTSVEIPNSVTYIAEDAFYKIPNITYSGTVTGAPWGARCMNGYVDGYMVYPDDTKTTLAACTSVATGDIVIPNTVTTIGDRAFFDCTLKSLTIPNTVTSIGEEAFYLYCYIDDIYCYATTPPSFAYGNPFGTSSRTTIHVPFASIDAYKANEIWGLHKIVSIETMVKQITLDHASATIAKGESVTLTATVAPANATDNSVTWTSSDNSIATVDENGKVTAVGSGTATITCTAADGSGVNATCQITVTTLVESITLDQTSATIEKGESITLTATVAPADATDNSVTWTSSDNSIATVDENGKVTAVGNGSAVITCTAADGSGINATCQITVTTMVNSITLDQTSATIEKGESITLTATVAPADATDNSVTWTSSDNSIATVDENGKVTAVGNGSAVITCTAADGSGVNATCQITVMTLVESITLDQTSATIEKGESITLTATVAPADATDNSVTWTSSNNSIATVDENGKVTAVGSGSAIITCTAADGSGVNATCWVTVTVLVKSITLDQTSAMIAKGQSITLTPTIAPVDAANKIISWTTSDNSVATVESNGKVTGVGTGTAVITCAAIDGSGVYATCEITVTPVAESITLDQTSATIEKGETVTLIATVLPDDTPNKEVAWQSSDESVLTVSSNGEVTCVGEGTATITATTTDGSNLSASCIFNCIDGIITPVMIADKDGATIYGTDGVTRNAMHRGINIIITKDGKRVKVLKK